MLKKLSLSIGSFISSSPDRDPPRSLFSDLCFIPDPFKIMKQISLELERDEGLALLPARVDWRETLESHNSMLDVPAMKRYNVKICPNFSNFYTSSNRCVPLLAKWLGPLLRLETRLLIVDINGGDAFLTCSLGRPRPTVARSSARQRSPTISGNVWQPKHYLWQCSKYQELFIILSSDTTYLLHLIDSGTLGID